MSGSWALMYHRVCARTPETACWFARGTAVTPEIFEAQVMWLLERFDVVELADLLFCEARGARPRVALTFDDGYGDILRSVAPICNRLGVTGACFASAAPPLLGEALWFDAWYAAVHAGAARAEWLEHLVSLGLPVPADLRDWTTGAAKRWLACLDVDTRRAVLQQICLVAGAEVTPDFYLSIADLRALQSLGWNIGGHGLHHLRLSDCEISVMEKEIAASVEMLDRVAAKRPRFFAYPDGAFSPDVARRVERAGFVAACSVYPAAWTRETDCMAVPRLFCRGDNPVPHPLLVAGGTPHVRAH